MSRPETAVHRRPAAGPKRCLVVVLGPIAAGKSTVCGGLASRLQAAGQTTVVVGVDEVAAMAPAGLADWDFAHQVHGAVVAAWLGTPMDTVIADGSFFSRQETDWLMAGVSTEVRVVRVLLRASYPVALRRVTGDPARGLSKDPAFLRGVYERFERLRPGIDPCDLEFDADRVAAEVIADQVATVVTGAGTPGDLVSDGWARGRPPIPGRCAPGSPSRPG